MLEVATYIEHAAHMSPNPSSCRRPVLQDVDVEQAGVYAGNADTASVTGGRFTNVTYLAVWMESIAKKVSVQVRGGVRKLSAALAETRASGVQRFTSHHPPSNGTFPPERGLPRQRDIWNRNICWRPWSIRHGRKGKGTCPCRPGAWCVRFDW